MNIFFFFFGFGFLFYVSLDVGVDDVCIFDSLNRVVEEFEVFVVFGCVLFGLFDYFWVWFVFFWGGNDNVGIEFGFGYYEGVGDVVFVIDVDNFKFLNFVFFFEDGLVVS